ncbi:MAG: GAF domain-containing protein [Chloroflexi bacterium]|nr:GAF domain-containing protein [Chloroflexota bacterium]
MQTTMRKTNQPHSPLPAVPHAPEAILILDARGVIRFATPAAAEHFGYQLEDVIGRSPLRFVAPEESDDILARWEQFITSSEPDSAQVTVSMLTADDRRVPVRLTVWRQPETGGFLVVHHVLDQLRDRLESLYSVMAMVAGKLDTGEVARIVLQEIRRLIPCDVVTIFMLEPDGSTRIMRHDDDGIKDEPNLHPDSFPDYETTRIMRATGAPLVINDTATDPRWTEPPDDAVICSWLGTPLFHQGEFQGELNLDSSHPHNFSQDDAELALALATQIAAVLHNARRYQEERRRVKRLQAYSEVSQLIRQQLDLDQLLEVAYREISRLMETATFFIGLYDTEVEEINLVGAYDHGHPRPDESQPASAGLSGLVLQTRASILIRDTEVDPMPEQGIIQGEMPRSILVVPLVTQDEAVGVISVQSYVPNAYTLDDLHTLETIAGSLAAALRNAQLYDKTSEQLAALETLHMMGLRLATVQDTDTVVSYTLRAVLQLLRPSQARLYLCTSDDSPDRLWSGHATGDINRPRVQALNPNQRDSLIQQVCRSKEPVVSHNLEDHPELQLDFGTPWLVQAVAAYPILRGDDLLGVLTLLHGEPFTFRASTLRSLEMLCIQAAVALENARYNTTLHARLDEVFGLQEMARRISAHHAIDDVLQIVVETMRDIYHCKSASVALFEPETEEVVLRAAVGIQPEYFERARFKLGEYVAGQVVATGEALYVTDAYADENFRVIDPGIRSMMCVPLTVHDQTIGVLSIDSSVPHAFSPDHERVLTIAGGQIAATIEMIRLLEEAQDHAQELADANAELEALHELRNELVHNLAHELRSPLALVRGYAGLLRDGELGPVVQDQVDALTVVDQKAASITRLVQDVLDLESIRADTLLVDALDLAVLGQDAIKGAAMIHNERGLVFEAEIDAGPFPILGDRDRLNQVLDNLLGNAAKFSPDGGTVTLHLAHEAVHNEVLVSVTDRGIGIPAENLPHIFERFYQGDKSIRYRFGGSGLGLSIAQRIVVAHGGAIWVESEEGQGSTFTFTLPLATEPSER